MRTRLANRELNPLLATLPSKFQQIEDYQVDPIVEIVEAFDSGAKVVALEAPTGSGKTLIAECVRRMLDVRAAYVCHNKSLQEQFCGDFPYSKVLWGRENYDPNHLVCPKGCDCAYQRAKYQAIHSPVPVLNSAYWLNEVRGQRSRFKNTGLVIFDEADTLEQVLMGQVEVFVSEKRQYQYGILPPRQMTKTESYRDWCKHCLERIEPTLNQLNEVMSEFAPVETVREWKYLLNLQRTVQDMQQDLELSLPWVYAGGAGSKKRTGSEISFKPVKVERFGETRIWAQDKRFLLMSATLFPSQLVDLGWTDPHSWVSMESQFHPKNRQVIVQPVADMTRKGATDAGYARIRDSIRATLHLHEGERGVIHSVSYSLTSRIADQIRDSGRRVFTYRNSRDRESAIQGFVRTPGAVLIAPSVDRGVDLPGDLCRWQIIVKVPYLSLGDRQTTERLYNTPDGRIWYQVHVARTIMQMVGRGVRSKEDYCTCYILDSSFLKWYRNYGYLLPKWFKRGIRIDPT